MWRLNTVVSKQLFHLTEMELIQIEQYFSLVTNISLFTWDRHEAFLGRQINATVVQARHTEPTVFDVIGPNLAIDKAENERITGYHKLAN